MILVSTLALLGGKIFIGMLLLRYRNIEGILRIKWSLSSKYPNPPPSNPITPALKRLRPEPSLVI